VKAPVKAQRVRLVDVAEVCKVSKAAVVQALNRSPETCELRPATRERIRATAVRMGYRPDWRARVLGGGRTGTIGLLYDSIYPPMGEYPGRLMGGLARRLDQRGNNLLLVQCHAAATWREMLAEGRVDAVAVIDRPPPGLLTGADLPVPLVLLNCAVPGAVPQVLPDDRGGAALVVARLAALGRRRIVHLTRSGDSSHSSRLERSGGYAAAMAAAGLEPRIIDSMTAFAALLDRADARPDALFAYDDALAITAMQFALGRGLRVPQDLAVVGVNNSASSATASPPLASLALPEDPLGFAAADLLLDLVAGATPPGAPLLLPEMLIERPSMM